jgi:hypothetical protein
MQPNSTQLRYNYIEAICFAFILLWVYAAFSKLMTFEKFQAQLSQSPMLTSFAFWVAWMVPLIEIGLAFLLWIKSSRFIGLLASFTLMTMFSGYIFLITRYSAFIPCSCGGILEKLSWDQHLLFNLCLVVAASSAFLVYPVPSKEIICPQNNLLQQSGLAENL